MPRRVRRRYLAVRFVSKQPITRDELLNTIKSAIVQLFGEYGASKTNLALIEYKPETNYAVIRCSHKSLEMVRASITSITEIEGKRVAVYVQRVSGTLKALHEKHVSR